MWRFFEALNRTVKSAEPLCSPDDEAHGEGHEIVQPTSRVVLAVDDDPLMRWAICEHLKRLNFSAIGLETAADGYEHILKLRERVGALITDMVLPGGGGWHLVQSARRIVPSLAVVFISGTISEQVVASASSHARTAFLEKPFELSELTSLLSTPLSEETGKEDKTELRREVERNQKAG